MSYLKTKKTSNSVAAFINEVTPQAKREDCKILLELFSNVTQLEPKLWGSGIIGFGSYTYKTKANKEGEWFLTGFTPRKSNISLHLMFGLDTQMDLLSKLGRHKMGKGCLYINTLSDIDIKVLEQLVLKTFEHMKNHLKQ